MNASTTAISGAAGRPADAIPWWQTVGKLAWHDLHARYAGAALGLIWSVAQPLVMALILWLVIGYGMRANRIGGVPCLVWILPGMAAWSFFAEALHTATLVLQEYAFLVKKVRFPIILLPPVKIFAALAIHLIFLALTMAVLLIQGVRPSWHWLLLPYYTIGMLVLLTGLAWITASLHALARDVGHMVNILLQFGFWLTPVFWSPELIPNRTLAMLFRLNPMFYIVDGYRQCLALQSAAGIDPPAAAAFWLTAGLSVWAGLAVFRRLRTHFADTL